MADDLHIGRTHVPAIPTTVLATEPRCELVRSGTRFQQWMMSWPALKPLQRVTHSHPEGIRGAQATAAAVFLARTTRDKTQIKNFLESQFGYDLNRTIDAIRPAYSFAASCQESVPESIIAFLESKNFEQAIRNAVSLGGDADTMACIAGGIAGAFYGVPSDLREPAFAVLDERLLATVQQFENCYS